MTNDQEKISAEDIAALNAKLPADTDDGVSAANDSDITGAGEEDEPEEAAQDALSSIANSLHLIEKHLCAHVYIELTRDSEKTHLTFLPDVFFAIYDGTDPFAEVEDQLRKAASMPSQPLEPASAPEST